MSTEVAINQLKRAFDEGFTAFNTPDEGRKMVAANPYRPNSILAKEWERGFNRAYWENGKIVHSDEYMSAWEDKQVSK